MKVIQVQQHKSIFDTRVPPLSGLKKIQNYVFDLGNVIGAGNFSKVYRGINQLNSTDQPIQTKYAQLRWSRWRG